MTQEEEFKKDAEIFLTLEIIIWQSGHFQWRSVMFFHGCFSSKYPNGYTLKNNYIFK